MKKSPMPRSFRRLYADARQAYYQQRQAEAAQSPHIPLASRLAVTAAGAFAIGTGVMTMSFAAGGEDMHEAARPVFEAALAPASVERLAGREGIVGGAISIMAGVMVIGSLRRHSQQSEPVPLDRRRNGDMLATRIGLYEKMTQRPYALAPRETLDGAHVVTALMSHANMTRIVPVGNNVIPGSPLPPNQTA